MHIRKVTFAVFAALLITTPTWGQQSKGDICLLYCPQIAACTLTISDKDQSCLCKCNTFPEYTNEKFIELYDSPLKLQLTKSASGDVVSFSPAPLSDTKAPGLNIPDIVARETSPHPRAEPGDTPRDVHERLEREKAMNAADRAMNDMRAERGKRGN